MQRTGNYNYHMIDTTKLCINLQRNIRQVLVLFSLVGHCFVDLHVDSVNAEFDVANALRVVSVKMITKELCLRHLDSGINVMISVLEKNENKTRLHPFLL